MRWTRGLRESAVPREVPLWEGRSRPHATLGYGWGGLAGRTAEQQWLSRCMRGLGPLPETLLARLRLAWLEYLCGSWSDPRLRGRAVRDLSRRARWRLGYAPIAWSGRVSGSRAGGRSGGAAAAGGARSRSWRPAAGAAQELVGLPWPRVRQVWVGQRWQPGWAGPPLWLGVAGTVDGGPAGGKWASDSFGSPSKGCRPWGTSSPTGPFPHSHFLRRPESGTS